MLELAKTLNLQPSPPPQLEQNIRIASGCSPESATPLNVGQKVIAQVFGVTEPWLERDRWKYEGKAPGMPYVKLNRKVMYNWVTVWYWFEQRQSDR